MRKGDLREKFISFLRKKGGTAEVPLVETAKILGCHTASLSTLIKKLINQGLLVVVKDFSYKERKPRIVRLNIEKLEERKLKKRSSILLPKWDCNSLKCLRARETYLEDILRLLNEIKRLEEENGILKKENERLNSEIKKLRESLGESRQNIVLLEEKIHQLLAPKVIKTDRNGVIILPNEEKPDES